MAFLNLRTKSTRVAQTQKTFRPRNLTRNTTHRYFIKNAPWKVRRIKNCHQIEVSENSKKFWGREESRSCMVNTVLRSGVPHYCWPNLQAPYVKRWRRVCQLLRQVLALYFVDLSVFKCSGEQSQQVLLVSLALRLVLISHYTRLPYGKHTKP